MTSPRGIAACPSSWSQLGSAIVTFLFLAPISTTVAKAEAVRFDVSHMVACQNRTTADFQSRFPQEKLVEVELRISSLIVNRSEGELIEYLFTFESTERTLTVVDFAPKTVFDTSFAGNVDVQSEREKNSTFGVSASGHYAHVLSGDASAGIGGKRGTKIHYELKPPMSLVSSAGTMSRASGAYFKLKPTDQNPLEGASDISVVFRVPASWRGDYARVTCQGIGTKDASAGKRALEVSLGSSTFLVALFLEGDEGARKIAAEFVQSKERFRRAVIQSSKAIQRNRYKTFVHELGASLSLADPQIPDDWFPRLLWKPVSSGPSPFERHLPEEVRRHVDVYQQTRRRLHRLCGARSFRGMTGAEHLDKRVESAIFSQSGWQPRAEGDVPGMLSDGKSGTEIHQEATIVSRDLE